MAKRMLIDATHPEETRVVVLNGNRLEEFDFESSTKQQVKGNIYLAKVTRVEPSLQAAFVEYGANRHGFLAFSEIHPDYFRIPVGDRPTGRGGAMRSDSDEPHVAAESAEDNGDEPGGEEAGVPLETALPEPVSVTAAPAESEDEPAGAEAAGELAWTTADDPLAAPAERPEAAAGEFPWTTAPEIMPSAPEPGQEWPGAADAASPGGEAEAADGREADADSRGWSAAGARDEAILGPTPEAGEFAPGEFAPGEFLRDETALAIAQFAPIVAPAARGAGDGEAGDAEIIDTLGGDEFEDAQRQRSRTPRHYKIQEVIKRRQIMLVQVTKEERGNKGAALTTYLSLAGRYCVLMPNTARGGGVSRKITSISDRRRLKDILEELDIPEGMGVIVRTAGAERSKAEIKRDYEYLLRLWNEIRELTLKSTAPALIYEEGNLIKRSIRDLYTRDIDEVLVEGEAGYRTAKAFMKMLMPSHAKRVQPYRDPQIGLLHRFQVESQIDAIHSPIVQLRSGGYVVINQTEALVAIDVNSGRSTRERNIEETALRTNLEAAEEIARQLRLRDLAGLIVIDFIDMEEHRNNGAVERRIKDALKNDRARIQVGRISPFGLLEMSRQRLRPSLVETSTQPCPHCGGTGFIRSTESTALYVLRSIEEEGMRRRSAEVCIYVPTTVALYILNHKRDSLAQLEGRYGIHVLVARDDALIPPAFRLERLRAYGPGEAVAAAPAPLTQASEIEEDEPEEEAEIEEAAAPLDGAQQPEPDGEDERGRSRRRRRRRRRHEDEAGTRSPTQAPRPAETEDAEEPGQAAAGPEPGEDSNGEEDPDGDKQRRRRGRRGGRRRGRREDGIGPSIDNLGPAAATVEIVATDDAGGAEPGAGETEPVGTEIVGTEIVEAAMPLPEEIGAPELVLAADTAIETASLPALAGEPSAPAPQRASDLSTAPSPGRYPASLDPIAANAIATNPISDREGRVEEAAAVWQLRPARHAEPEAEPDPVTAIEPEECPPPPEPATPSAPRPEPDHVTEPAHTSETVSQPPANPHRGWWQRLIQS